MDFEELALVMKLMIAIEDMRNSLSGQEKVTNCNNVVA